MPQPAAPRPKEARLFRNNRSQAVRIPVEFELPGESVLISRDGDRLILEPIRKKGLLALLDGWEPLDEELPAIEDPPIPPRDVF